jgi:hypothetical protein
MYQVDRLGTSGRIHAVADAAGNFVRYVMHAVESVSRNMVHRLGPRCSFAPSCLVENCAAREAIARKLAYYV